ncbi:MAG: hypothetical protein E5W75_22080, partial [Mesorhizobium sp.]
FIRERAAAGREALRFAVVHPHSGHNYELRYWLAACGIDPERQIEIVIVPPPFMADALATGRIDGYCVGEPWNSAAVAAGTGHIVTVKALLWRNSPEKVIGARKAWAEQNPEALAALLRALHHSARWCQDPANRAELAALMAQPGFLGQEAAIQMPILTGHLRLGGGAQRTVEDFFVPFDKAANFPWKSHALWFYTQMVRWGHVAHTPENLAIARDCYRPDLYRSALKPLGAMLRLAPASIPAASPMALPGIHAVQLAKRGRVAILTGCAQSVLDPGINDTAISLLTRLGVEVVVPPGEGCCGALVHHMGREEAALASARQNVDAWTRAIDEGGLDAIIIT